MAFRRGLATDTSTSTGGGPSFPPPGFKVEEAKKPLPKEPEKKPSSSQQASATTTPDVDVVGVPRSGVTSVPKTDAQEAQSLSEMAAGKVDMAKHDEKKAEAKKEEKKKLTIAQKIKKEILHYWDGTKLLATEVRISTKLAVKMAAGYELSRRENRQVSRLQKN